MGGSNTRLVLFSSYRPPGMSSIEVDNFIDLLKINIETIPSDR